QLPAVEVREESGEGAALLAVWEGAASVILCDAVHSGAAPGTIYWLDAYAQTIPKGFFHYSTHAFSVAEVIELARAFDQLPPALVVYGVEGADFTVGTKLSPLVAQAVLAVVQLVLEHLLNRKN